MLKSGIYGFVICRGGTDMCFVLGFGRKRPDLKQYRISGLTRASTKKCSISHCEAMCIIQCNFSEGNRSRRPDKVTRRFRSMSCQFRVGVPTILLQYYDARP